MLYCCCFNGECDCCSASSGDFAMFDVKKSVSGSVSMSRLGGLKLGSDVALVHAAVFPRAWLLASLSHVCCVRAGAFCMVEVMWQVGSCCNCWFQGSSGKCLFRGVFVATRESVVAVLQTSAVFVVDVSCVLNTFPGRQAEFRPSALLESPRMAVGLPDGSSVSSFSVTADATHGGGM